MTEAKNKVAEFIKNASSVSAIVHEVSTVKEAFEKTIELCREKAPCENLVLPGECNTRLKSSKGKSPSVEKTISAPNLDKDLFNRFKDLCLKKGIKFIHNDLREYSGGIDIGFTRVNFGIAETGSLVLNSDSEDTRLTTMLCEIHVALLAESNIRKTALAMSDELKNMTQRPSSYTAFITGASRTADIERVLALGVHGPLELHIMLLKE